MTSPKETKKAPITDRKEMEINELSDKEFRRILLEKFSELLQQLTWPSRKNPAICYNMDEPEGPYVNWNKPDTEREILHDLTYT